MKKTIPAIAAALESIRDKLIFAQYEMKHNENLSAEIQRDNDVIDVLMSNYNQTDNGIKKKQSRLKKLQSEQKALSPLHIFKHKNLAEQIEALRADIDELKSQKAAFLENMLCKSEDDIPRVKQRHKRNDTSLENIKTRNAQLTEQNDTDIAEYNEISNNISPENIAAVREERRNIRNSNEKSLWKRLQEKYGQKYSYELLKSAESDIDKELGETIPKQRKSVRKDLAQKRQQADAQSRNKRKRYEWEL